MSCSKRLPGAGTGFFSKLQRNLNESFDAVWKYITYNLTSAQQLFVKELVGGGGGAPPSRRLTWLIEFTIASRKIFASRVVALAKSSVKVFVTFP